MIFVDSDVLIWILRGDKQFKGDFSAAVNECDGAIYISPMQFVEILAGVRETERLDTELFLNSLQVLHIDSEIGRLAGEYIRKYKKSHNVHTTDAIIAATTKINNLKLWTCNKKHYPMLKLSEFYK
ncbi:hypothetical protein A2526_00375 [candidate division WOR-1 bacterium RIFOXYD2_FULL_36_8]|uniref:PIN domain-containing protein n=1 Tax=candidate division WOR-1 bacterium RIFOXYB2_FULL_36_35 TaxID=1802578 RepID=A0A1F4S1Y3_UNCSA|nr:MAG: hypothetical protein A2230_03770 [candidate division WOR-1 bacterium RIFOXYA2_FULL_36_21]OGC14444.1 MAG: hypothetical protein A2290_08465 [candidate division WOR-1 bacterium RIFOXYB2_FULL_36_35]OGC18544.1 MAG: hypothetical protein A2282_03205 [candidate division WOR-1 bacterium RIFOXYA12_FULL_36_13]OGC37526.1 MAG: hypothetical protein A2526_00375 [candidate division WOR-1 bacterium RIFOXYD2_FULL_36_8]